MARRASFLLLMILCTVAANALDWGSFVAGSNRSDDVFILDELKEADLDTRIQIIQALGARNDPYAEDILVWLLAGFSRTTEYKDEILIRVALKSLFDVDQGNVVLNDRLAANAGFVQLLVENTSRFHDPQLKAGIVRLFPHLAGAGRLSALMEIGTDVVTALRDGDGQLPISESGLALDYLATVQAIGNADFMEQCLEMARLSTDSALTERARQTAARIAGVAP